MTTMDGMHKMRGNLELEHIKNTPLNVTLWIQWTDDEKPILCTKSGTHVTQSVVFSHTRSPGFNGSYKRHVLARIFGKSYKGWWLESGGKGEVHLTWSREKEQARSGRITRKKLDEMTETVRQRTGFRFEMDVTAGKFRLLGKDGVRYLSDRLNMHDMAMVLDGMLISHEIRKKGKDNEDGSYEGNGGESPKHEAA